MHNDGNVFVPSGGTIRRAAPVAAALLLVVAVVAPACAPARLRLPVGGGRPVADVSLAVGEATASCRAVRSMTAQLAVSGRAGGQRIRGRVVAGIDRAGGLRLEGVAPFGAPLFVLAARGGAATLVLPRDRRVIDGEPPAAILEALIGIALEPADLLSVLAGCPPASVAPVGGRAHGESWLVIEAGGDTLYLEHVGGRWRSRAWSRGALRVEYPQLGADRLERVVFHADGPHGEAAVDLVLGLSEVEINEEIPAGAFEVRVPAGSAPMTIAELRAAGPLGSRAPDGRQ